MLDMNWVRDRMNGTNRPLISRSKTNQNADAAVSNSGFVVTEVGTNRSDRHPQRETRAIAGGTFSGPGVIASRLLAGIAVAAVLGAAAIRTFAFPRRPSKLSRPIHN